MSRMESSVHGRLQAPAPGENRHDALTLMSIQHELVMAIGLDLDLERMLRVFMQTALRRLNIKSAQAFLVPDGGAVPRPAVGVPRNWRSAQCRADQQRIGRWFARAPAVGSHITLSGDGQYCHAFSLGELGYVLLGRHRRPLSEAVRASLRPIFERLRLACLACREHATTLAEIDERERAQRALAEEKARAEVTLHAIGDAVITTDRDGRIDYLNPVAERLTRWHHDEARGRAVGEVLKLFRDADAHAPAELVGECLADGETRVPSTPHHLVDRAGRGYGVEASAAAIRDGRGGVIGAVVVLHDITHLLQMKQELSWQANHDPLTGLPNRREFEEELAGLIHSARQEQARHALLYLDLDHFKVVNDTSGHIAGDELLRQIAWVMEKGIDDGDTLARIGGDEFCLLLGNRSVAEAHATAESLRRLIQAFHFVWEERTFRVGVSVGIVPIDPMVESAKRALAMADMACREAKELGRNRIYAFQPDRDTLDLRRREMEWVSRLVHAIGEQRFELRCQPIEALVPGEAGEPHLEILLRLREAGQLVHPGSFIPAAERFDLMPQIDLWVIRSLVDAVEQLAPGGPGGRLLHVNVNLSGQSLGSGEVREALRREVPRLHAAGLRLCLEITETAAISNMGVALPLIEEMRELGCAFALDDFGSGLSSFSYLKNLPVDYLKIDGSFVHDIARNPVSHAMVRSIHELARVMGIATVGEFVEDRETLDALRGIGVNYAQGNLLGEPEPLASFLARLCSSADDLECRW